MTKCCCKYNFVVDINIHITINGLCDLVVRYRDDGRLIENIHMCSCERITHMKFERNDGSC